MTFELPTLITFIGYLCVTLGIGLFAYKATDTLSDYILGGRQLGPAVTALSVGASDMSYFNWILVAPKLRSFTERAGDSLTIPDFLEQRFGDKSHTLRFVSALTIIVFFTFYVSSGLVGGAILFEKVFGLDYTHALIIGAVVIVSYTF